MGLSPSSDARGRCSRSLKWSGDRFFRRVEVIAGAPLLVILLHVAGVLGLYDRIFCYDSLMHLFGGFAASVSLGGLIWHRWGRHCRGRRFTVELRLLLVLVVALIAVGWEALEVGLNMEPNWHSSVADTVKDQLLGVVGAWLGALCVRF